MSNVPTTAAPAVVAVTRQTYTLMLNDYQRSLIMRVLNHALIDSKYANELAAESPPDSNLTGLSAGGESALEEVETLIELFGLLPKDESESPGTVHGLCL